MTSRFLPRIWTLNFFGGKQPSFLFRAGDGYYLIYLGNEIRGEWTFDLPVKNGPWARPQAGEKYRVEILDTWNMTVTPWPVVFETAAPGRYRIRDKEGRAVRLPDTPYLLLRIKKIQ